MFGSKKEIYTGQDNDNCNQIIAKLKENGIKFYVENQIPHSADIGRGAGVGRYGESGGSGLVKILVDKKDYEAAVQAIR